MGSGIRFRNISRLSGSRIKVLHFERVGTRSGSFYPSPFLQEIKCQHDSATGSMFEWAEGTDISVV